MDTISLDKNTIGMFLKESAADMRALIKERDNVIRERDAFMKFAKAVEILPALEKSGAIAFPSNLDFAEKALRLASKSTDELDKLAYMAEHVNNTEVNEGAKLASDTGAVVRANGYSELTNRVINI